MVEISTDFIIGINLGVTIGYWVCWYLFVREKKNQDLLEIPEPAKKR